LSRGIRPQQILFAPRCVDSENPASIGQNQQTRPVIGLVKLGRLADRRKAASTGVNFIEQFNILRFSPREGRLETFETGVPVMALGIRKSGRFIAATGKRIATWDTARKVFEPLCDPLDSRPGWRFNDAATDAHGRFWAGTLNDANPKGPDGELYCIQGDGSWQVMDKNITVANGRSRTRS
jgi:hypothetical protein